ncbi:hypothetical protein [Peribacillus simplex]|uniref:hypothetical protein n=1 Tax=Peribacillus simplex TaxID=1478 RepID=UPI0024C17E0A|nr:hypothetical protein [Peribacillus simplex]WHY57250.1 hypothetical protein QNH43_02755 [Peribacillus simplex]
MKRLTDWYFNSLKKQILIPFLALIMISGMAISYMSYKNKVSESSMTLVASADENSAAANEVAMTMEQIAAGAIDQIEVGQNNEMAVKLLADKINDLEGQASKMATESENMFKASENGITQVQGL